MWQQRAVREMVLSAAVCGLLVVSMSAAVWYQQAPMRAEAQRRAMCEAAYGPRAKYLIASQTSRYEAQGDSMVTVTCGWED